MKTLTPSLLGVGALLLAGAGWLWATEPSGGASPVPGRVLLLENERALQGDIERIGEQYRLRRSAGETWIPANQVVRVCASLEEAYAHLHKGANLNDPDERLRLANWCKQYDLFAFALAEAEAALQLRPEHAPTQRLVGHLRETVRKGGLGPKGASHHPEVPLPRVDLTSEALGQFATKVQPILMNTCACCHSTGRGGKFQLTRAYEVGLGNKRTVQQNVTAVLAQVNTQEPGSTLLTKAISIHAGGMNNAPLRSRQAAPYRALEDWVRLTLANNPQLRDRPTASIAPSVPPTGPASPAHWGEDLRPAPTPATPAPMTQPPPVTSDPVDPNSFNRQFHPERAAPPQAAPPKR